MANRPSKKLAAYRQGFRAEFLARWYLRFKGYRILENRYKTKQGEIDIIARKGTLIAFVEVKSRRSVQEAIDSVGYQSQRRIQNAADIWLTKQPNAHDLSMRFDIVAVVPGNWPKHFEDAF